MPVSCAAILCVRNEGMHIRRAISDFVNDGVDVIVIDNGSTDQTLDICSEFKGNGLLFTRNMPWSGNFDLTQQLEIKNTIISQLRHDWIIHADADEWMHSSREGESLVDGITRISDCGFNVINFEEFVFLPKPNQISDPTSYKKQSLHYYYFAPRKKRLMRAWNRILNVNNASSGGHVLRGENINVAPESFILRHYIVLSYQHALDKYIDREFSRRDLVKQWHGNRLNFTTNNLKIPDSSNLKKLDRWNDRHFDFTDPKTHHYWEWK